MAENSKIEWTDHTANLWHGCTKVHQGCRICYAEALTRRWKMDVWGDNKNRKVVVSFSKDIFRYNRLAIEAGKIHSVFVGSMMDIFEDPKPVMDNNGVLIPDMDTGIMRKNFFEHIVPGCQNLRFLFLTKRPENIYKYVPESWIKEGQPENVWYGTSISKMEHAYNMIEKLEAYAPAKLFLSVEPQLEVIPLNPYRLKNISWVIQGGESGFGKRPFSLEWADMMRNDCAYAKVPYFFKQIDKLTPIPDEYLVRQFPF